MQEFLVAALRFRSPQIRERWAALLHVEPVVMPLANPHALVHLVDWTLEEILRALASGAWQRRFGRRLHMRRARGCCGRNPLEAHFCAGEQAMREALVLVQAALPSLDPVERDASLAELDRVLSYIARREIEAFCGVCQHRTDATRAIVVSSTLPCGPDRVAPASCR